MYKQNSLKARLNRLEAYQGNANYDTALLMIVKNGRYTFNKANPEERINKSKVTYAMLEDAINNDSPNYEKLLNEARIETIIIDDITRQEEITEEPSECTNTTPE